MDMTYFDISDFDCQETGENEMDEHFLLWIDELRFRCGFPFIVNSGYRSPSHSAEKGKVRPGQHAQGRAADIRVYGGAHRFTIILEAIRMGFRGIGVAGGFVHVDTRTTQRMFWTY